MANFLLIHLGMITYIFFEDMNYHCAELYINISTNMDTTNIFKFHARSFTILPQIATFGSIQLGSIAYIVS